MSRDYLADMDNALEKAIEAKDGSYIASLVGAELADRLSREDPDLLFGWLRTQAHAFVGRAVSARSNSTRAALRANAPRKQFKDAAEQFGAEGDPGVLAVFHTEFVVDKNNTRKRVGDMRAADCLFVADRYTHTASYAKMEAAFHRAVAERIGDLSIAEVYTDAEYRTMYRSVTGRETPVLPSAAPKD